MKSFNESSNALQLWSRYLSSSRSYNLFECSMQRLNVSPVVNPRQDSKKHEALTLRWSQITWAVTSPDLISQRSLTGKLWGETTVKVIWQSAAGKNAQQYPSRLQLIPIKRRSSASLFRDENLLKDSQGLWHFNPKRHTLLEKHLYPLLK